MIPEGITVFQIIFMEIQIKVPYNEEVTVMSSDFGDLMATACVINEGR